MKAHTDVYEAITVAIIEVIETATERFSGAYFCDADTPESTVQFLQYLHEHGIGLEVGV
jgi:hypothetical protein